MYYPFKKRTRVQVDERTQSEITRQHYMGMEVQLQNRIDSLKDAIATAQLDLHESEAILASVHAAQKSLAVFMQRIIEHFDDEVTLAVEDLTDPTMPMGENGNSRVD